MLNSFHPLFHWTTGPQPSVETTSTLISITSHSLVWCYSACIMYHEHAKLFNYRTSVGLFLLRLWTSALLFSPSVCQKRSSDSTGSITLIWSVTAQTSVCIRCCTWFVTSLIKRESFSCPTNQREHLKPCPWRGVWAKDHTNRSFTRVPVEVWASRLGKHMTNYLGCLDFQIFNKTKAQPSLSSHRAVWWGWF